jgi:hypothetical protein
MGALELTASDGSLSLQWAEPVWCQVSLSTPERQEALGADSLKIVKKRISRALDEHFLGSPTHRQTLDGLEYTCFISLFEKHRLRLRPPHRRRTRPPLSRRQRPADRRPVADARHVRAVEGGFVAVVVRLPRTEQINGGFANFLRTTSAAAPPLRAHALKHLWIRENFSIRQR